MSARKPYNVNAGYIASHKYGNAYIVIYNAAEAGIDTGQKYAVVCETHSRFVGATSMPKSREIMKCPDFCEQCMPEAHNDEEREINWEQAAQEARYVSPDDEGPFQCDPELYNSGDPAEEQ